MFLQTRLNQCEKTHAQNCRTVPVPERDMPARLLRIPDTAGREVLRLIQNVPPGTRYTTLSWCWGKGDFFKTTTTNITSAMLGISLCTLRQEFQDAVHITRRLGLKYIWIDALCIIQDDPADWAREAQKMGSIYEHSYLTVAAAIPRHEGSGVFRNREVVGHEIDAVNGSSSVYIRERLEHEYYTSRGVAGYGAKNYSRHQLADRAWCFQELKLSPRVIHYCATELVWECRSTLDCECEELPNKDGQGNQVIESLLQGKSRAYDTTVLGAMWCDTVEEYTKRHLTVESDIFPALGGLAVKFSDGPLGEYMSGIWQQDLARGLMWEHAEGSFDATLPATKRAPSWSWASILGYVTFNHWWMGLTSVSKTAKQLFTYLDHHGEYWNSDPFTRFQDNQLKLEGVLLTVRIRSFQQMTSFGRPHCELRIEHDAQIRPARLDLKGTEESREALIKEDLFLLRTLRKDYAERDPEIGLLLQATRAETDNFGEETYRRIGTTRGSATPEYDDLPRSGFTLV